MSAMPGHLILTTNGDLEVRDIGITASALARVVVILMYLLRRLLISFCSHRFFSKRKVLYKGQMCLDLHTPFLCLSEEISGWLFVYVKDIEAICDWTMEILSQSDVFWCRPSCTLPTEMR